MLPPTHHCGSTKRVILPLPHASTNSPLWLLQACHIAPPPCFHPLTTVAPPSVSYCPSPMLPPTHHCGSSKRVILPLPHASTHSPLWLLQACHIAPPPCFHPLTTVAPPSVSYCPSPMLPPTHHCGFSKRVILPLPHASTHSPLWLHQACHIAPPPCFHPLTTVAPPSVSYCPSPMLPPTHHCGSTKRVILPLPHASTHSPLWLLHPSCYVCRSGYERRSPCNT